jgi:hypothetical protein
MLVTINNQQFRVRWSHYRQPSEPLHTFTTTRCDIFSDFPTPCSLVGSGEAHLYFRDKQFTKNLGRKVSLTKALKKSFPNHEHKGFRSCFWETYYRMRNGKW